VRRIIDILFLETKHKGHFANVQFSSKRHFIENQNINLSLIFFTWLCQLQQNFLHPDIANLLNGNWNKNGKYCGVSTNPMAKYAPLAKLTFQRICHPKRRKS
jgi:hypothetical protein